MKTRGQVAQKLKQTRFRHTKREMKRLLKKRAPNCSNNRTLDLDIGPVGVCSLDCEVCDVRFGDRAPGCDVFDPRYTAEGIKSSLKEFFQGRTVAQVAVRFPDVAALLWVLIEDGADDPQEGALMVNALPADEEFFGVPVWVNDAEELDALREGSKPYLAAFELVQALQLLLDEEDEAALLTSVRSLKENAQVLVEKLQVLQEESEAKDTEVERLTAEAKDREEEVLRLRRANDVLAEISPSPPWWRKWWPF